MTDREKAVSRDAPAKINLSLRVVGRRPDGYHLLDSLVGFAALGDRVTVQPADTLSLEIAGPYASALSANDKADNLVLRAAKALRTLTGTGRGAAITLHKTLPVAGGIGGGSADAAAAIHALIDLWKIDPPEDALAKMALNLGADVPVCLSAAPSRMQGVGERLTPLPSFPKDPAPGLLLVNPGVGTSTAEVFGALSGNFVETKAPSSAPWRNAADLAAALTPLGNNLTEAACKVTPEIARVLGALPSLPGCRYAAMSGSGATCFALFDDAESAHEAARTFKASHPSWWIEATTLLT